MVVLYYIILLLLSILFWAIIWLSMFDTKLSKIAIKLIGNRLYMTTIFIVSITPFIILSIYILIKLYNKLYE